MKLYLYFGVRHVYKKFTLLNELFLQFKTAVFMQFDEINKV